MNLPNLITIGRLLSVPVAVYLLMQSAFAAAFALFVVLAASDALDGYVAKRRGQTTQIGALLDPLADKALLIGMYVTLGLQQNLANWLVVLVVFRDLMIVGGVLLLFLVRVEVRMRPLRISKLNTAAQLALVALVLARLGWGLPAGWAEEALVYLVAATTAASGAGYIGSWARQIAGLEGREPPGTR